MTHEEEKIQAECFRWFWNTYTGHRQMLFHVDNNSWNAVIGAHKKALGVCSGVSDLILILRDNVIFIEMKTLDGVQLEKQIEFDKKVTERGHIYFIVRSVSEFKELIINLIGK